MNAGKVTFAIQVVEANHVENAFWVLASGEYDGLDELNEAFNNIPANPRDDSSDRDYIIDKMVGDDIVADKFVSADTVERLTGRKIGRMRAGAKNSLRAEIRRFDANSRGSK